MLTTMLPTVSLAHNVVSQKSRMPWKPVIPRTGPLHRLLHHKVEDVLALSRWPLNRYLVQPSIHIKNSS